MMMTPDVVGGEIHGDEDGNRSGEEEMEDQEPEQEQEPEHDDDENEMHTLEEAKSEYMASAPNKWSHEIIEGQMQLRLKGGPGSKWKSGYDDKRKYKPSWEDIFPWVTKADDGSENAFCKACMHYIAPKISRLATHEKSKKHVSKAGGYAPSIRRPKTAKHKKPKQAKVKKSTKSVDLLEIAMEPLITAYYSSEEWEDPFERDEQLGKILIMIEPQKGDAIVEGKTKIVSEIIGDSRHVMITNKDRITAGDGARAHDLEGKAAISNATNAKVFSFLKVAGIKTGWIKLCGETSYVSRRCHMIPLEWVTRRVATGSFLRRHLGVAEGYRFTPPKLETFFKDDENHDPQCSEEQILEAKLNVGGVIIGKLEYDIMSKTSMAVFEILERAWGALDCALIDMKIEFGIDCETQELLVTDTIDSDSWRLWPSGDKRLMMDKQVYRNFEHVTEEGLNQVRRNFQWVADRLECFIPPTRGMVVVLMGSSSDAPHSEKIRDHCKRLGVPCELRVTSAHKGTDETLAIISRYEGMGVPIVFVAAAGRSNGLGPVASANTNFPVINCPPMKAEDMIKDIWSSLNLPSGLGCSTVLHPEAAAMNAASILALTDHVIWARVRSKKLNMWVNLKLADRKICESNS